MVTSHTMVINSTLLCELKVPVKQGPAVSLIHRDFHLGFLISLQVSITIQLSF